MRNNFNERHNVNAYKNTYRQIKGKEGEHCDYYTLSDLNNVQKIEFIFQRTPSESFTDKVIDMQNIIILPSIINVENMRSEERRVGKECRYRWSRYHYKKNV